MISKWATNLVVFVVGLGFAFLFVWLGELVAKGFDLPAPRYGIVIVLSFFMYMYLKYVATLKLENRTLRMFREFVRETHGLEDPASILDDRIGEGTDEKR